MISLHEITDLNIVNIVLEEFVLEADMHYLYVIENNVNDKIYFGITKNPKNRMKRHIYASKNLKNSRIRLYNAMNLYNSDNFKMTVLYKSLNRELIGLAEMLYINLFDTIKFGYNISIGGGGVIFNEHLTEDHKEKVANSWTDEKKLEKSILMKNFWLEEENRNIRSQQIKNGWTEEVRSKHKETMKKIQTEEMKIARSNVALERFSTEESRKIHSETLKAAWDLEKKEAVRKQKLEFFKTPEGKLAIEKANISRKETFLKKKLASHNPD